MFYPMLDLCVSFDCFFKSLYLSVSRFLFHISFCTTDHKCTLSNFSLLFDVLYVLFVSSSFFLFFNLILCLWFSFVRSPSRFVTYTRGPFRTCKQALICLNVELLRKRAWWNLVLLRWPWKMILHVRWCVFFIFVSSSHKNQMTHWSDGYGVIKMINIT